MQNGLTPVPALLAQLNAKSSHSLYITFEVEMKINFKGAFILPLIIALLSSCAPKEDDGYIAVFSENGTSLETAEAAVTARLEYSYMDHVVFAGGGVCSTMADSGIVPGERCWTNDCASAELAAHIDGIGALARENSASYIYLCIGNRDMENGTSPDEYAQNIVDFAQSLTTNYPECVVTAVSLPPRAYGMGDVAPYNKALENAVSDSALLKLHYLDITFMLDDSSGCLSPEYDSGDGITLNFSAGELIASLVADSRYSDVLSGTDKFKYMYMDMTAERPDYAVTEGKVAYLTFDDGPSKYTDEILDILDANGIKATFFITGKGIAGREETLKREAESGHVLGLHSYTHDYEEIYASTEAFLNDFAKVYYELYRACGVRAWCFRFPGGSHNNHNRSTADEIIDEIDRRGFTYFDWDSATGDATSGAGVDYCIQFLKDSNYAKHSIVLMHDASEYTPQYLQAVIDYLVSEGYTFETVESADVTHFKK